MPFDETPETVPDPSRVRMQFLRLYFADQEAGEVRTLAEYQARFPGYEEVVAAAHRTLHEPSTEVVAGDGPPRRRAPSDRVGPYRIVRLLGRGGQGEVFLAEDTRVARSVALKVLSGFDGSREDSSLVRFRREAEVASRLHHPGICPIFEMDVADGLAYIAMPYLAGQTLGRCIARAQAFTGGGGDAMTEVEGGAGARSTAASRDDAEDLPAAPWMGHEVLPTVVLIERVARALHAAHETGIVHRDIKPGNVMVLAEERPVILDFGLARDLRGGSDLTLTTALLGTLPYMSPEQLRGQHPLDRRTDVYSLGVTLYECLALRRPFEGPNQERLFQSILDREPADVRARLAFATEVGRRSLDEPEAEWLATVTAIADRDANPIYRGLEIAPQLGLVPLGKDPDSGLFEFAHLQTGLPPRRDPASGKLEITEDSGLVFVLIPGGAFLMGAQSTDPQEPHYDPDAISIEAPVHEVSLAAFFISKYEVTQAQWARVTGENPAFYRVGDEVGGVKFSFLHPVENVSWIDATEVMDHLGLLLPTEAQWEYACRAGTDTPWSTGDTTASLADHANLADEGSVGSSGSQNPSTAGLADGHVVHAPVGCYRPNPFGLHDMHGNVAEWCRDRQDGYWNPVREGDGLRQIPDDIGRAPVVRGGGFHVPAEALRSAARRSTEPEVRHRALGIRPLRRIDP